MIDLKKLIESGVQFGHQTWRWCPKMKPYIWGERNGVHLIDVSKTAFQLNKAAKFLEDLAAQGKPILWVGTKKAAQSSIQKVAEDLKSPYVTHRWIGGTLTNNLQVRKSITKLLHFEDVIKKADNTSTYTKKEYGHFQKIVDRLEKNVGGIRKLSWPVGALVVIDVKKEHVAIKEAQSAGIPVVALVDTNCDPSMISYVIPGNDDVNRSISLVVDYLAEAVKRGKAVAATTQPQQDVTADQMIEQLLVQALSTEEEEEENKRKRSRGAGSAARKPSAGNRLRGPKPQKSDE